MERNSLSTVAGQTEAPGWRLHKTEHSNQWPETTTPPIKRQYTRKACSGFKSMKRSPACLSCLLDLLFAVDSPPQIQWKIQIWLDETKYPQGEATYNNWKSRIFKKRQMWFINCN